MSKKARNIAIFARGTKTISFSLDEEQIERANNWAIRHRCTRRGIYGTIGDKFHFIFCPTGIGDIISVHCSCGKSYDLTGDL